MRYVNKRSSDYKQSILVIIVAVVAISMYEEDSISFNTILLLPSCLNFFKSLLPFHYLLGILFDQNLFSGKFLLQLDYFLVDYIYEY